MEIRPIQIPECIGCKSEPAEFFYCFKPGSGLPLGMNCISELDIHFKELTDDIPILEQMDIVSAYPKITHDQWVTHRSHIGEREHLFEQSEWCGICNKTTPGNAWWTTANENRPV